MTNSTVRRRRILTWHVHGNYLCYLSQVPHTFCLVTDAARSPGHTGRSGTLPWGPNVEEVPVERVREERFDMVLYQSRDAWETDRLQWLTPEQRALPRVVLEHDPPQEHPTDTRHWVDDPGALLVHVTPFNALMWDAGRTPFRVVEHGVLPLSDARYNGQRAEGIVVVNHLRQRGRRLGADLFLRARDRVPLQLAGMGSTELGGLGDVENTRLPAVMADYRFFFHPVRYTSLGLALIEAMLVGLPVVGLATTELATVIRNGDNGFIDTRPEALDDAMQRLLRDPALAGAWGQAGRRTALERFAMGRFIADWQDVIIQLTG